MNDLLDLLRLALLLGLPVVAGAWVQRARRHRRRVGSGLDTADTLGEAADNLGR